METLVIKDEKEIPDVLRNIRNKKGLTLMELATILGLKSPSTISLYETGQRKITFERFLIISKICGYDNIRLS